MKRSTSSTAHKRRPVAGHHRKVHRSFGFLMVFAWTLVIACTVAASIGYFEHHRSLKIVKNGIQASITKVTYDDIGAPPFTAPQGEKFLIVELSVANTTAKNYSFAPVVQTYITDENGRKYYMSPAILKNPIVAGPIRPHQKVQGMLSYLVPLDAKKLSFVYNP